MGGDFGRRGKLLTKAAAAGYLGISVDRLDGLLQQGEIAVLRNAKGRVAGFYAEDLDAWVERRRQPAACDRKRRPVDEQMQRLIRAAS